MSVSDNKESYECLSTPPSPFTDEIQKVVFDL